MNAITFTCTTHNMSTAALGPGSLLTVLTRRHRRRCSLWTAPGTLCWCHRTQRGLCMTGQQINSHQTLRSVSSVTSLADRVLFHDDNAALCICARRSDALDQLTAWRPGTRTANRYRWHYCYDCGVPSHAHQVCAVGSVGRCCAAK